MRGKKNVAGLVMVEVLSLPDRLRRSNFGESYRPLSAAFALFYTVGWVVSTYYDRPAPASSAACSPSGRSIGITTCS